MRSILRKPHPFIFNAYSCIVPSMVSFLVIVVLAPVPFHNAGIYERLVHGVTISILVALGILITVLSLQKSLPNTMSEDQWTVGKELLLFVMVLLSIIVLLFVFFFLINPNTFAAPNLLLKITSTTLAISILPMLVLVLFEQYRHQQLQLKKATALTEVLSKHNKELLTNLHQPNNPPTTLLVKSENNTIELQLDTADLIYLKSDGNYVEVYFKQATQVQKKVIRNRLKSLEEALPSQLFFRCHNRFIVNGKHILKIEGNARNLNLHLKNIDQTLPVSRTKAKDIANFLENLPQ
ncbi:MAG: LytR/AlgR family response regulator transcription factor [Aureispira sp.]